MNYLYEIENNAWNMKVMFEVCKIPRRKFKKVFSPQPCSSFFILSAGHLVGLLHSTWTLLLWATCINARSILKHWNLIWTRRINYNSYGIWVAAYRMSVKSFRGNYYFFWSWPYGHKSVETIQRRKLYGIYFFTNNNWLYVNY